MIIFKHSPSYKPTTVCINFKILQSKRAVVKDLEHHFGNLDGYIKRYEIPVSDSISIIAYVLCISTRVNVWLK